MSRRIHYFNPGHETAVLLGTPNYTPPHNVRIMTKDLSFLPAWYARPGDLVLLDNPLPDSFRQEFPDGLFPKVIPAVDQASVHALPTDEPIIATPWGISPQSLHKIGQFKKETGLRIHIPQWDPLLKVLIGRQTAAGCLDCLRQLLPYDHLPATPRFFSDIKSLEQAIEQMAEETPFLLKAPYSSSGRGLLWLANKRLTPKEREWAQGAIAKQGAISLEKGLDKILDLAFEYEADGKGHCQFEGFSIFGTEERGNYSGNRLETQEKLRALLLDYLPETELEQAQEALGSVLADLFATYEGNIGVDMLIYKTKEQTYRLHPCVEINTRQTMGRVALELFRKLVSPDATGDFRISFGKKAGQALAHKREMTAHHPLELDGQGKIRKGYLSLCPVDEETHYWAEIWIQE